MDEQKQDANWEYSPDDDSSNYAGSDVGQSTGVPLPEISSVQWSASEYISHEKPASWYATLLGVGLLLTGIIYVVTKDFIASFATLFASVSMGVYAKRKPAVKQYQIGEDGIHVDDKFYPFGEFRSFSVVEEGAIDSIWLKPLKRVRPTVVMYFAPDEEQKIVDVISNFLPHEQKELDAVDRLSKRMRF